MKEKKMVPELRFPEFEGEWIERAIEVISIVTSGGTPDRSNHRYWNGKIPWITTSLINFNEIENAEEYITEDGLNNSSAKIFPVGTILMAMYGQGQTRGKVGFLNISAATNQACAAIQLNNENNRKFVFYTLARDYEKIRSLSNDGGQKNLSAGLIKNLKIKIPQLKEQQKIASFLTSVDKRITLLIQKKEKLEQYKKGVMQKIFNREIRFKDENGREFPEWEIKKAKTVFYNHSNKNHNGDLPILSASQEYGMILRNENGIKIQASEKSITNYKIVEPGDFVISLRSFQGGLDYSSIKGICSPAYTIIKRRVPITDDFYKFYFKKDDFIERLSKTVVGIRDGKQITFDAFGELRIPYPFIREQQKIASFLSSIDRQIEQADRQIALMKQWKKGLLQKMFV